MRIYAVSSAVLLCCLTSIAARAERPNILVMMADDMGYSDLGCYGGEIHTPNIDALAAGGVRMTQFYNCSRCCPTRASLLTGVYPHEAGVGHMTFEDLNLPGYHGNLNKNTPTIAEVLHTAGYRTYVTGKWHVSLEKNVTRQQTDDWPLARGFDHFYGNLLGSANYFDPAGLTREDKSIEPRSDSAYQPQHYYYTDAIADNAILFLKEHDQQHRDQPFFMYVAFTAPHFPLNAPDEAIAKYKGMYDSGYEPIRTARYEALKKLGIIDANWPLSPQAEPWDKVANHAWEARCMEVYAAQIDRMDSNVGKIMAALKSEDQLNNTLVLYLSDNGGCAEPAGRTETPGRVPGATTQPRPIGTRQLKANPPWTLDGKQVLSGPTTMPGPANTFIGYGQDWANVSNTPFREYKRFVHEGGISTPLIAFWPEGIVEHGTFNKSIGHVVDIMATCVALSGAKFPDQFGGQPTVPMQGVSLEPIFKGGQLSRDKPIFFEHEGNRAIRDGQWKLVATAVGGKWELYDMESDRTEMHDLASQMPDRVKQMSDAWQKWAQEAHVLPLMHRERSEKIAPPAND